MPIGMGEAADRLVLVAGVGDAAAGNRDGAGAGGLGAAEAAVRSVIGKVGEGAEGSLRIEEETAGCGKRAASISSIVRFGW
jgi:hypothetical protein